MPPPDASAPRRDEARIAPGMGLRAHRCIASGIGHSRETDPDAYRWDNNTRFDTCIFQYTLAGEGRFRDGKTGRTWPLPAGRGFLAVFPSDTQYWLPAGGSWEFVYVCVGGDAAFHHTEELIRRRGPVVELPFESTPVRLLRALQAAFAAGHPPDEFALSAEVYRLFMELYRTGADRAAPPPEPVARAREFIEEHYHEIDIDVATLARRAGLSRYHFSRLFKAHIGQSPYAYLLHVRLRRAQALLAETDLPIKQIGMMVGFGDYAYFCNSFRKHLGCTPGSVRRRRARFGGDALSH
ncbi:MAG: helix-turn-helix domain-containing protein [Planctomycetota bacterium]